MFGTPEIKFGDNLVSPFFLMGRRLFVGLAVEFMRHDFSLARLVGRHSLLSNGPRHHRADVIELAAVLVSKFDELLGMFIEFAQVPRLRRKSDMNTPPA